MGAEPECRTCRLNLETSAPGGVIYRDNLWVLEHAIEPVPMAGWLILKPVRHVEAFADLTPKEAESFGPLVCSATLAMTEVLNPVKVYLSMYMEAEGFAHLHVHLIPRFEETPAERRGPHVFEYLRDASQSGENQADVGQATEVAAAIRVRMNTPNS